MAAEIGLVASVLGIADIIVKLAKAAQRNKEKCHLLGTHVEQIMRLLKDLDRQWTPDAVNSMLESLRAALNDAKELVESCQKTRNWSRVFKNQKKARKIDALDARISKIMEQFHVANTILILSINKERFFMNVLQKLLADACHRDARSSSSYVRPGAGRRGGTEADVLTVEVVSLAVVIVEEAQKLREDRDEIQQLTKLVRLVSDLMQDPQYSELSRDTKTRLLVNNLKHDLDEAYTTVLNYKSHKNNMITRAFTCGVDGATRDYSARGPDDILKAAYKIEYYVHVLPVIAMRQIYEQNSNA